MKKSYAFWNASKLMWLHSRVGRICEQIQYEVCGVCVYACAHWSHVHFDFDFVFISFSAAFMSTYPCWWCCYRCVLYRSFSQLRLGRSLWRTFFILSDSLSLSVFSFFHQQNNCSLFVVSSEIHSIVRYAFVLRNCYIVIVNSCSECSPSFIFRFFSFFSPFFSIII